MQISHEHKQLVHTLLNSLSKYRHQLHGKRVWLACSGGRDSLSLANLCRDLYDKGELPFLPQLLHVNHGMQDANKAWAQQVRVWADEQGMSCQILNVCINDHSEQSARLARYTAMQAVMRCEDVLMLGHHSDDQIETVLMRLFNGTGVKGLGGMLEWTPKQLDDNNDNLAGGSQYCQKTIYLWRPWLTVSRTQITEYANSSNLNYIDDPTNTITPKNDIANVNCNTNDNNINNSINDRAWLRSVLMPTIYQRYPQASASIARTSQLMQDASAIIDAQVQADLAQLVVPNPHIQLPNSIQSLLNIDALQALPPARQSALIYHWLSPSGLELSPPSRLVNAVLDLCQRGDNNHQTCLYWNNNQHQYEIRRYKNKLYRLHSDWVAWLKLPPLKQTFNINSSCDDIDRAKEIKHSDYKFNWQLHISNQLVAELLHSVGADDTAMLTLCLEPLPRYVKLGLAGRVGRKSGKKLLQDLNQPAFMRQSVALVCIDMDNESIPLFIVTLHGFHVLQSEFSDTITAWIRLGALTTTVRLTDKNAMC